MVDFTDLTLEVNVNSLSTIAGLQARSVHGIAADLEVAHDSIETAAHVQTAAVSLGAVHGNEESAARRPTVTADLGAVHDS